jgi:hypothetical protein
MSKKNGIKIKNISRKKSYLILSQLLEKLVAEAHVNPEAIKFLSNCLTREVKQEKEDTREYNNNFISKLDVATLNFMDAGVKNDFFPGEGVLLTAWLQNHVDKNPELADYLVEVVKEKFKQLDHMKDPILRFCAPVSYDIGSKYLLRTEQMDTFLSVFSEIESNRSKFVSDEDWSVIMTAIKKADKRITNEDIIFLSPIEEGITGKHRELTKQEKEKFGLGGEEAHQDADFRKDEHDLVSLKELAYVMKGNTVDYLSPFAGSFLKYMPELNAAGIRAIIFEVVDGLLSSIKISKFDGKQNIPYGPTEAAIALANCYPELKTVENFKSNVCYYVSVSGYVCAPEDVKSFGYSEMVPKLNKVVAAGETFLFQVIGDLKFLDSKYKEYILHPSMIRLYFCPYKPSELHPIYQKMTVLYGQSDNMFHSCGYDPNHLFYSAEYAERFRKQCGGNIFSDQPSARYIYKDLSEKNKSGFLPPEVIFSSFPDFKKKYGHLGEEVSNGMYGENVHVGLKYLEFAQNLKGFPNEEAKIIATIGCLYRSLCLPSAFLFYNYTQNEKGGLSSSPVATTIRKSYPAYDESGANKAFSIDLAESADLAKANAEIKQGKDYLAVMKDFWAKIDKRRNK